MPVSLYNFVPGQVLNADEMNSIQADSASVTQPNSFAAAQTFQNVLNQSFSAGSNNQTPLLNASDVFLDFVASGVQWTLPSPASLTSSMSAGVAYLGGQRTIVPEVSSYTFPTSSDTYVSINNSGGVAYQSVANGASAPAALTGYVQAAKIVTGPIQSPTPTLTAGTGGSLAVGTYGVALVAYDATGYGAVGASGTVTVTASGSIDISWTNPLNETSMDIYATTAGGTALGLVASGVTGNSYTYTGSTAPGVTPPTTATSNAIQSVLPLLWGRNLNKVISVVDFGADPTGTNDSTSAIQNANDAAYAQSLELVFPGGTYLISQPGIQASVTWRAEGNVVLKAATETWSANGSYLVKYFSVSGFSFSNFTLDLSNVTFEPGVGNPGNVFLGVIALECSYFRISKNTFAGFGAHVAAIAVVYGQYFNVENNYFSATPSNQYNQSILVSSAGGVSSYGKISGNIMIGSAAFFDAQFLEVSNNIVNNWAFGGGLVFGPSATCMNNTVTGNICFTSVGPDINDTYPAGIENWSPYSTITGNVCFNNSGAGISNGANNVTITGNICYNNNQSGRPAIGGIVVIGDGSEVYKNGSFSVTTGNCCFDNQSTPTQLYGYSEYTVSGSPLSDTVVQGNKFYGNATDGVLLVATNGSYRGPSIPFTTSIKNISVPANGYETYTISNDAANTQDIVSVSCIDGTLGDVVLSTSIPSNGTIQLLINNLSSTAISISGETYFNFVIQKTPSSPQI